MTQKVAVVAVHGVADQAPASSARSIADLLCNDKDISSFTEVPLRIARDRMDSRVLPAEHASDAGLSYMQKQLAAYRATPPRDANTVYETVRLEGKRHSDGTKIDVYEVYWADLSRAGETWYRLLAEFYQLILHLPSLGRNGLRSAMDTNPGVPAWKLAHRVQWIAVWLLTVPAALLNAALLSFGLLALSSEVPVEYQEIAALGTGTLLLAAVPMFVLRGVARMLLWRLWLPILVVAGYGSWLLVGGRGNLYEVLAIEAVLVAAGGTLLLSVLYSVMKPKAWIFGALAATAIAWFGLRTVIGAVTDEAGAYFAAITAAAQLYRALELTWLLIFASAIAAAVLGIVAARSTPKAQRRAAWRATWTARFSLGLPTALFAIFTLAIWFLVVAGIKKLAPLPAFGESLDQLLMQSAKGFEYFAAALLGFLAVALFAAGPSIVAELKHPRPSTDDESRELGQWLTRGMYLIAMAAELFTAALGGMLLIVLATVFPDRVKESIPSLDGENLALALATTAAIVGLLLTAKRFTTTFRSAVDVLLDIDNYLRQSPKDATPRARIAERYVSLLRHLYESKYDHIVVIAHSQGTVISADVLHYLSKVPDPVLARAKKQIPLRLFTMGSPLRQIYAKAFPYLYAWITDKDELSFDSPDPRSLNVEQWANAYCSGDYVGRNLWNLPEAEQHRLWVRAHPMPKSRDEAGAMVPRVDFCAGAGAHTHYWDGNGEDVAAYLKSIV